jgi:hypothetical protein
MADMIAAQLDALESRVLLNGVPTAVTLGVPPRMTEGLPVVIRAVRPADRAARIVRWDVDWGDGSLSRRKGGQPPAHTYAQFGTYPITLTGRRRDGQTVEFSVLADVANVPPRPRITGFRTAVPFQPVPLRFLPGDSAPEGTLVGSWRIVGQASLPGTPLTEAQAREVTWTFTRPGRYRVEWTVRDAAGLVGQTRRTIRIAPVVTQPDPNQPGRVNLVAGGTAGNDVITFRDRWGAVEVVINGRSRGLFNVSGRIIAYGGEGNDVLAADATIGQDSLFDGGDGNDTLAGGSGRNDLRGGPGRDLILTA